MRAARRRARRSAASFVADRRRTRLCALCLLSVSLLQQYIVSLYHSPALAFIVRDLYFGDRLEKQFQVNFQFSLSELERDVRIVLNIRTSYFFYFSNFRNISRRTKKKVCRRGKKREGRGRHEVAPDSSSAQVVVYHRRHGEITRGTHFRIATVLVFSCVLSTWCRARAHTAMLNISRIAQLGQRVFGLFQFDFYRFPP